MKKWITAGVTVLGLALVLALTVLVLQQNGFLAKPSSPDKASGTGENVPLTEISTSYDEKTPEKNAAAAGASEDLIQAYLWARQKDQEAKALLKPGASYTMPYPDTKRFGEYNCMEYTVTYHDFFLTKKASDFQVEWNNSFTYDVEFDRNGNITNDWTYAVMSAEVFCEDWMDISLEPFFYPRTTHAYRLTDLYTGPVAEDEWQTRSGGELYAWNPLTANPEHPIETTGYGATLEGGVTYHMVLVYLMEDKFLPEGEELLLAAGHGGRSDYVPVVDSDGKVIGKHENFNPDPELFPHRELP